MLCSAKMFPQHASEYLPVGVHTSIVGWVRREVNGFVDQVNDRQEAQLLGCGAATMRLEGHRGAKLLGTPQARCRNTGRRTWMNRERKQSQNVLARFIGDYVSQRNRIIASEQKNTMTSSTVAVCMGCLLR